MPLSARRGPRQCHSVRPQSRRRRSLFSYLVGKQQPRVAQSQWQRGARSRYANPASSHAPTSDPAANGSANPVTNGAVPANHQAGFTPYPGSARRGQPGQRPYHGQQGKHNTMWQKLAGIFKTKRSHDSSSASRGAEGPSGGQSRNDARAQRGVGNGNRNDVDGAGAVGGAGCTGGSDAGGGCAAAPSFPNGAMQPAVSDPGSAPEAARSAPDNISGYYDHQRAPPGQGYSHNDEAGHRGATFTEPAPPVSGNPPYPPPPSRDACEVAARACGYERSVSDVKQELERVVGLRARKIAERGHRNENESSEPSTGSRYDNRRPYEREKDDGSGWAYDRNVAPEYDGRRRTPARGNSRTQGADTGAGYSSPHSRRGLRNVDDRMRPSMHDYSNTPADFSDDSAAPVTPGRYSNRRMRNAMPPTRTETPDVDFDSDFHETGRRRGPRRHVSRTPDVGRQYYPEECHADDGPNWTNQRLPHHDVGDVPQRSHRSREDRYAEDEIPDRGCAWTPADDLTEDDSDCSPAEMATSRAADFYEENWMQYPARTFRGNSYAFSPVQSERRPLGRWKNRASIPSNWTPAETAPWHRMTDGWWMSPSGGHDVSAGIPPKTNFPQSPPAGIPDGVSGGARTPRARKSVRIAADPPRRRSIVAGRNNAVMAQVQKFEQRRRQMDDVGAGRYRDSRHPDPEFRNYQDLAPDDHLEPNSLPWQSATPRQNRPAYAQPGRNTHGDWDEAAGADCTADEVDWDGYPVQNRYGGEPPGYGMSPEVNGPEDVQRYPARSLRRVRISTKYILTCVCVRIRVCAYMCVFACVCVCVCVYVCSCTASIYLVCHLASLVSNSLLFP